MIRLLFICLSICLPCHGVEPKPLLAVIEQDPWRMVIGSDSPVFVIYDDGSMIYPSQEPSQEKPFQIRKTSNAEERVRTLLSFDMSQAKARYELSTATDQITTVIWTPKKQIDIYGDWKKEPDEHSKAKMGKGLPPEIRDALSRIEKERSIKGESWLPEKIEVMFWPYEYAPDESIIWPKDWPGLRATDTRKRGQDSFSVFLPSQKLSELRKFLAKRKEKGAVLIDGKKMAESHRFPFPGEAAWMN